MEVAAPISPLDVVKEEKSQSEDNTEATVAKGREEAVASAEVGQTGGDGSLQGLPRRSA